MPTAEILAYDKPALANVTVISASHDISTHGMNPFVAQKVKRAGQAVKSARMATLELIEVILEVEYDEEFNTQFPGGWRQLYQALGLSDTTISLYWKVANVLARAVGMFALRESTITELRMFYEVTQLAEELQIKRDCTLEDAGRDAITAAIGLSRPQLEDLRKGRLDYDPNTRSSMGEFGSVEKGVGKKLKDGLGKLAKSVQLVEGEESGKAYPVSQDKTLELLGSILENPSNDWLRETLVEFAPTSQTPEEFVQILRKRITISNARVKGEASDAEIAAAIKGGMAQKATLQTFRIGTGRLNRVLELVREGKL